MSRPLSDFLPVLRARDRLLRTIRCFFHERDFLEVSTPVRIAAPALEEHIDAEPSGDCYLRTSPELALKRLLAAGCERLFEIGPCFRQNEYGPRHHPEYTMLEWYRLQADYMDILADTENLFRHILEDFSAGLHLHYGKQVIDCAPPWERMTVREAFTRWAGWDPVARYDPDRFDMDLVDCIEPALPHDRPFILYDYPAAAAALARRNPGCPAVAERWELYIAGVELANAYSELTDAAEQQARFADCAEKRRQAGRAVYPLDEAFLAELPRISSAGGIAMGMDRLLMLLTDCASLDDLLPFRRR